MRIVLCGKGGQGVMTISYIIGQLATDLNYNVISSQNHGLSVRGGSINSFVKIGNYYSPSIENATADLIFSTDYDEIYNNISYLSSNGVIISDGISNNDFSQEKYIIDTKNINNDNFNNNYYSNSILLGKMISRFNNIFNMEKSIEILKKQEKINYDAFIFGLKL